MPRAEMRQARDGMASTMFFASQVERPVINAAVDLVQRASDDLEAWHHRNVVVLLSGLMCAVAIMENVGIHDHPYYPLMKEMTVKLLKEV